MGRRVGLLAAVALLAGLLPAGARAGSPSGGCSGGRPATAYDGAGRTLQPQPPGAPSPCLVATGFASTETHLAVTGDGSLVYEPAVITPGLFGMSQVPGAPGPRTWSPASPAGITVSADRGATWRFDAPGGSTWQPNDNALYVDPVTGRLFMAMLSPNSATGGQLSPEEQAPLTHEDMLTSADDGTTWSVTSIPAIVGSENPRFMSAPPPAGDARPAGGYPDVTYWCGNREIGLTEPLIIERECYRSLDAGVTWEMRSIVFTNPVPQHRECGANREDINSLDGNYAEAAPDGSLYLMVSCTAPLATPIHNGVTYLARSSDEAASFPILYGPDAKPVTLPLPAGADYPELRIADGLLVFVYAVAGPGGPMVMMRTAPVPTVPRPGVISAALAWSPAVRLTPPGLSSVDRWAVETRGRELALSYIAGSKRPGAATPVFDGYLSVLRDLRSAGPVWMGMLNDRSAPLSDKAPASAKDDFIGIAIGPDGRPWASFPASCSADPSASTDPACQGNNPAIEDGEDRGVVGSLLFPSGL